MALGDKFICMNILLFQYSFVTSLTSLVVVKPNETKAVDAVDASQAGGSNWGSAGNVLCKS